jgi:hypothetical protein
VDYGSSLSYPADWNTAPMATLVSVSSEAGINSPKNILNTFRDFVHWNGAGHFQIRLEMEHDDAGSAFKCLISWPDVVLTVTYVP